MRTGNGNGNGKAKRKYEMENVNEKWKLEIKREMRAGNVNDMETDMKTGNGSGNGKVNGKANGRRKMEMINAKRDGKRGRMKNGNSNRKWKIRTKPKSSAIFCH